MPLCSPEQNYFSLFAMRYPEILMYVHTTKKMYFIFEKWGKNIQAAAYNGARTKC